MKKLMMLFVAAAAITFAACNGNEKGNANAEGTQTEVVENDSTVKAAEDSTEIKAAPEAKGGETAKAPEAKKEETEKAK